jgi:hypothetical protein
MMPKKEYIFGDHFGISPQDPLGQYMECSSGNDPLFYTISNLLLTTLSCSTSSTYFSKSWNPIISAAHVIQDYGCVYAGGSIKENTSDNFNINLAPNPTSGIFQLSIDGINPSAVNTIEIYNLMGQLISQSSGASPFPMNMDLSKHANGIYYIRVIADGQSYMQKVMVDHQFK